MPDRRRYKRVRYGAFAETIKISVKRSWLNVIKKNELNGIEFTLSNKGSENVYICKEKN